MTTANASHELRNELLGHWEEYKRRLVNVVGSLPVGEITGLPENRLLAVPLGAAIGAIEDNIRRTGAASEEQDVRKLAEFYLSQFIGHEVLWDSHCMPDSNVWHRWIGEARWAADAFPTVTLSSDLAASLVTTSGELRGTDLRLPWPSFVISVDGELLSGTSGFFYVWRTFVPHDLLEPPGSRPYRMAICVEGVEGQPATTLWHYGRSLSELVSMDLDAIAAQDVDYTGLGITDNDVRLQAIMGKLSAGVVAAIGSETATIRRGRNRQTVTLRQDNNAGGRYSLGMPVTCSLTRHVSKWLRGSIRQINRSGARWLVRGHWRQQACGKGHRERRRTWIAPHWKGPERATALVRPHEVLA